ncbi:class I SAM-dependent methyltransferase [Nocardioides sp. GXZ039]|uniref:class I SAM-dependent methyltransferase n=1 Tax=Nocardioides sp. GXZ039 TaxID=3136018 RepID=UPI0030F447F5
MSTGDPYAALGDGYARRRRPDPRIAAAIAQALGDARSVVNVGAGAGSYEPTDRLVLAVEPSATMIGQRPPGAAPAVQAFAEDLPFDDRAFDVGLAVLTVHHWRDPGRGLTELRRVSRRQVVLTWDPVRISRMWLVADYLPEIATLEESLATLPEIAAALAPASVRPVPVPWDCTDGFLAANWRRPRAYLDHDVRAGASSIAALPRAVVERAMRRLRDDLDRGRWHARHRDLLARTSLDVGYRLVVSDG